MSGHAIHIKVDGRTYSGTFKVDRKILTVSTTYGSKSAEIGPKVTHDAWPMSCYRRWSSRRNPARARRSEGEPLPAGSGMEESRDPTGHPLGTR